MHEMHFSGKLWRYSSDIASWFFVTLKKEQAELFVGLKKKVRFPGWGQIPVIVTTGTSTWQTSLFPSKNGEYFLAIKAQIRKKENI